MIFREDLQNLTRISGFNLWQTEKDYLQHIFLLFLSRENRNLVFKGGTALQKVYGLNRFSIDLDFTSTDSNEFIEKISKDITDFGFETKVSKAKIFQDLGKTVTLKIKGPLFDGTEKTLTSLRIDISLRKDLVLEPDLKEIIPAYPDIKPYFILVMKPEEIFAEKVRTIFWRTKPKDVYDIWFLIRKKIPMSMYLINKKLNYYKLVFEIKNLKNKLEVTRKNWENELKQIITFVPDFNNVMEEILAEFKNLKT